jgi:peptidoglycan/xylan/chitin deacetylase (PgdA/CDA1 family)
VAITYDDGPHTTRTKLIADELEKYGFHATFFVVGNRVDGTKYNGGAAMLYALEKGNEIAIHGYTHTAYYGTCSDETYAYEISQTVKAIQKLKSGYTPMLMRPIGGDITETRVSSCEYSVIMWSVDSLDYKNSFVDGGIENIVNNVMSNVKDGDIILMHDIYENTYEASKVILKRLYDEGYEVVTVSELLGSKLVSGQKFSKR